MAIEVFNRYEHKYMLSEVQYAGAVEIIGKHMTADASHELRTPAAVIMSECEYMTDCDLCVEEMKESAESVKRQTERMTRLFSMQFHYFGTEFIR